MAQGHIGPRFNGATQYGNPMRPIKGLAGYPEATMEWLATSSTVGGR